MTVTLRALALREESLRDHQVEIVPSARHRDIEEAPLLLYLGRGAGAEVRGNAAIDDVQHEDRSPFLAFGGMDGRKDQIIFVEQRRPGLVAGRFRRIKRELRQEPLSRGISIRNLFELDQVGAPRDGVIMQAFEMWLVPQTGARQFSRPAAPSRAQAYNCLDKPPPIVGGAGRRRRIEEGSDWVDCPHHVAEYSLR